MNRQENDFYLELIDSIHRFNELRKVRNKSKPSGVERPFSRMYNFFVLESGDKWARTGTKFRPRNSKGLPTPGALARPTKEVCIVGQIFHLDSNY